ncbi:MAG: hypothetical protein EOP06_14710 [Proteobacteria bacterium]|nr:MAG: hypothetical protein EOP06_14710 [Pseudomonadota bacterium]
MAFLSSSALAGDGCVQQNFLVPAIPEKFSLLIHDLKEKAVESATSDLKSFCEWNRMARASTLSKQSQTAEFQRAATEGDEDAAVVAVAAGINPQDMDPWKYSLLGHPKLKLLALNKLSFYAGSAFGGGAIRNASLQDIKAGFEAPWPKRDTDYDIGPLTKVQDVTQPTYKAAALCLATGSSAVGPCSTALSKNLEDMALYRPEGQKYLLISPVGPFKRTTSSVALTDGLRRGALKVIQRIEAKDPGPGLLADLTAGFKESGLSAVDADNAAWDTLATLANSGPNFNKRTPQMLPFFLGDINHPEPGFRPNANYVALTALAELLPIADAIGMDRPNPRLYTLPENTVFPCDSGKTYHFWMSAYLARRRIKEGIAPEDAASAAYASSVGYQLMRDVLTDPDKAAGEVKLNNRFGNGDVGTRIDLVLAAGGARFGSNEAQNQNLNLARAFTKVLEGSPETPGMLAKAAGFALGPVNAKAIDWLDRSNASDVMNVVNPR